MTEEKRVLAQEELAAVTGGDDEKTCPHNKRFATKGCKYLDCPYRNGTCCDLYHKDFSIDQPEVIT